jgi:hypothetical protein
VIKKEHMYYEVPLLLTFFLTGIAGLSLPGQASSNTLLTMPRELLYVWYGVSTIGGGLGLLGTVLIAVPARWMLGKVLLRCGLSFILLQLAGYGLSVLGLFNLKALFVGAILLSFAWGSGRRVWKISRDIADFRKAVASQMEGVDELGHRPPVSGDTGRTGGGLVAGGPAVADQEVEGGDGEGIR